MKLMLITPGIDIETGVYQDFGIPAALAAEFLRENKIIPEKSDLNDILFLLTPAETKEKLQRLVDKLVEFETFIDKCTISTKKETWHPCSSSSSPKTTCPLTP